MRGRVEQQGDEGDGRALGWRRFSLALRKPACHKHHLLALDQTCSRACSCFPGGFYTRILPGFGQQRRPLDKQECIEKLVKDSTEPHSQHPSGAQAHCPTQTTSWLPRADSPGSQGSSPALIQTEAQGRAQPTFWIFSPSWGGISDPTNHHSCDLLNVQEDDRHPGPSWDVGHDL